MQARLKWQPRLLERLTRLVDEAPTGKHWLHEIKYDGYRMHARLDGELCALRLDDRCAAEAAHVQSAARLRRRRVVGGFFTFDLLYLDGETTTQLPLIERKARLQRLFKKEIHGLRYSEHVVSDGADEKGPSS